MSKTAADLCFDLVGSGPTWIDCATKVLSKRDTGKAQADARCMIEKAEARADCLESASCADLSPCDQLPIECPAQDSELQVLILEECPDTGLLSRLDGGA